MEYLELYDYLEGFEKNIYDIYDTVLDMKELQIESLVVSLFKLVKFDYYRINSFFNFYANSTLGGGLFPCPCFSCRMENIDSLARFSALYADHVLVQSPMDIHFNNLDRGVKINRDDLVVSILILLSLKPLVTKGIVGFTSSYFTVCSDYLSKLTKEEDIMEKKINTIKESVINDFRNEIKCVLKKDSRGKAFFEVEGLEKYGYQDSLHLLCKKETKEIKSLFARTDAREVEIPSSIYKRLGIEDCILNPIIDDIYYYQFIPRAMDSSYLTNREVDKYILDNLHTEQYSALHANGNKMISNMLFHEIPLIGEARIQDIVKLRTENEDSFSRYRDSMNAVLKDYDTLDQKNMYDIQRDIINPEINKITQTINKNKSILAKSIACDLVLSSAAISIGLLSNMLPLDYKTILEVLSGSVAISAVLKGYMNLNQDKNIKKNSFYFLWKLKNKKKPA